MAEAEKRAGAGAGGLAKGVWLEYNQERLANRKDESGAGRLAKGKAVSKAGSLAQARG
jgi:hypothetical protein